MSQQHRWPTAIALILSGGAWAAGALAASDSPLQAAAVPDVARAQDLVRMVRQDCGACHGMRLTGGLGPALTRESLVDIPLDSLVATIFHGRPGTAMPPWRAMITEPEARWIAGRLQDGFPEQTSGSAP